MNLLVPPGRAGARVHAAHAVAGGSELIASVAFTTRRRGQRGDATSIASIPSTIVWWKPRSAKGRDGGRRMLGTYTEFLNVTRVKTHFCHQSIFCVLSVLFSSPRSAHSWPAVCEIQPKLRVWIFPTRRSRPLASSSQLNRFFFQDHAGACILLRKK